VRCLSSGRFTNGSTGALADDSAISTTLPDPNTPPQPPAYATGLSRKVAALGPGDDAPALAKVIAGTSLFLWLAVMYMGRMLPYIGNSF